MDFKKGTRPQQDMHADKGTQTQQQGMHTDKGMRPQQDMHAEQSMGPQRGMQTDKGTRPQQDMHAEDGMSWLERVSLRAEAGTNTTDRHTHASLLLRHIENNTSLLLRHTENNSPHFVLLNADIANIR